MISSQNCCDIDCGEQYKLCLDVFRYYEQVSRVILPWRSHKFLKKKPDKITLDYIQTTTFITLLIWSAGNFQSMGDTLEIKSQ